MLKKLFPYFIIVFVGYVAWNCWQDEKVANAKATKLKNEIAQLKQNIIKANKVVAENETTKIELENKSIQLQEQINELLKDNQCANEFVPVDVSNKLYERAFNIRQSTSSSKSTN